MDHAIRAYRVWFKVFDSFRNEIVSIKDHPKIEEMVSVGIVMEAYTAADVLEQARLEALALTNRNWGIVDFHYPLQAFPCKVRPEKQKGN